MTAAGGRALAEAAVEDAHRRHWGSVLAATARAARDLDLAEECVQEAYATALQVWARDGLPRSPAAWLTTTARHKALDAHRRAAVLRAKLPLLVEPGRAADDPGDGVRPDAGDEPPVDDDLLRLVFTCCHPALGADGRAALTLRLVCGLTTAEVAHAFLVPQATVAARITRAKKKIASARIPYRVPPLDELPERLDTVLTVVHLVFTEGHAAPAGTDLVRVDLVGRALHLGRALRRLVPGEPEVAGLLGLMLLTDARRAARHDAEGHAVLLEDQDRSLWDRRALDEGLGLVDDAVASGRIGRFTAQAAIAACHARAPHATATDWRRIVAWYDVLASVWPSPVVRLNRAVAVGMVDGPAAALAEIADVEAGGRLDGYRYLPATKADMLRRLGRTDEAAEAYRAALALTDNDVERAYLAERAAACRTVGGARA